MHDGAVLLQIGDAFWLTSNQTERGNPDNTVWSNHLNKSDIFLC